MTFEIPLARPLLGEAESGAADRVLRSGRLTGGPEVELFEEKLAERVGRRHAIAVASGTVALELALWAAGIGADDEVLVPAFGFPAATTAALRIGARPIAVDIEPRSWNLDLVHARAVATANTRAVVSIDQFGVVAEAAPLRAFVDETGLFHVSDAACALGGTDSAGISAGSFGDVAILSFHPRKIVTTGEGGALLCDDDELATRLRSLRNLGQVQPGRFVIAGTNARMSAVAAAIGSCQLLRLDAILAERRLLAEGYRQRLAQLHKLGKIAWQSPESTAMPTHQTFAIELDDSYERDSVISALAASGIEAGIASYAAHRLEPFRSIATGPLPVADSLHTSGLALPLYGGMRSAELDRVCAALTGELSGEIDR